jgi:osmotically inducible protein OsmC
MAVTKAEAVWQGTLREGKGTMKLPKGGYEGPYTFASRFETGDGTNPEELIGAAHAGCFSMFLAALLSRNSYTPNRIHTTSTVHLGEGPTITKIELDCEADVPNLSDEDLQKFAEDAKAGCPVSKALASVDEIVLKAKLV